MSRWHWRTISRAICPTAHRRPHVCEPLDIRRLLAGEPVLVLVEQVFRIQDPDTVTRVEPWVLDTTAEVEWNLSQYAANPPPWQGLTDADGNGYAGDAYGWNFKDVGPGHSNGSPNFITDVDDEPGDNRHGTAVTESALGVFNYARAQSIIGQDDVKIMYVVTSGANGLANGSAALNYILDKKQNRGVNIVAVGTPPGQTDRAGALALANAGIMLIGGKDNNPTNYDTNPGNTSDAFFNATPRFGVQAAPLDNVIPVTTDSRVAATAYGVNSFYAGVALADGTPGSEKQSFAGPAAAAMATVAVHTYRDEHSVNPSI